MFLSAISFLIWAILSADSVMIVPPCAVTDGSSGGPDFRTAFRFTVVYVFPHL
jgi:hypothetical protein